MKDKNNNKSVKTYGCIILLKISQQRYIYNIMYTTGRPQPVKPGYSYSVLIRGSFLDLKCPQLSPYLFSPEQD